MSEIEDVNGSGRTLVVRTYASDNERNLDEPLVYLLLNGGVEGYLNINVTRAELLAALGVSDS